jgi:glycosyltransferase involved in cell wall biosynthesis
MGTEPLISVCIPSYNGARFIAATLESLLAQTLKNLEVIVTDDKSTDATVSVIRGFSDARIRLIENERNLGIAGNWIKVLSYASGRYVKLLCDDDILYHECLARQVAILENPANSAIGLAICNRHVINERNEVILRRKFGIGPGTVSGVKIIRDSIRWGTNLIGEPAVGLFRRNLLTGQELRENSNPYFLDLVLWAGLLRRADAFVDPEYLAAFRISGDAASTRIGRRQAGYFRSFAREIRSDPVYRPGRLDIAMGYVLSFQRCILRNMFINAHTKC